MSNHDGGYILNRVLSVADSMGIFETIGKEKSKEFALNIVKIGNQNDCNNGEILDGFEELGICYCCLEEAEELEEG